MKIIYDNLAFSLQRAGGVSAVWAGLLANIPSKLVDRYLEWDSENIYRKDLKIDESLVEKRNLKYKKLARFFRVNILSEKNKRFIYHSSTYRSCSNPNALNVVTVHDFIDRKFSKNYLKRSFKWFIMKRCILKAEAIICISENTKSDLLNFIPNLDVDKVSVIYNGKSEAFYNLGNGSNHENFVLFVGQRRGYKNFSFLVKALKKDPSLGLKIVGGGDLSKEELQLLSSIGKDRYTHHQFIENEELNNLYNTAMCLVYPSIYEGFGIPVIEAQSAGCPVVAANSSSIPEILGDSAILIDPLNTEQLLRAITTLKDSKKRMSYINAGLENAKRFSWEIMTESYMKVYKQVWSKHNKV